MDAATLLLAPIRVPLRVARAVDDLVTLAERARRDPDPLAPLRVRVDALIAGIDALNAIARQIDVTATEVVHVGRAIVAGGADLNVTAEHLDRVAREIVVGGADLTGTARTLHADTRELIDGGERLTEVSDALEAHLRTFHAALPRLLEGLDTVEELEEAVETVADTVEPLQGAAQSVGRVTRRFSRSA